MSESLKDIAAGILEDNPELQQSGETPKPPVEGSTVNNEEQKPVNGEGEKTPPPEEWTPPLEQISKYTGREFKSADDFKNYFATDYTSEINKREENYKNLKLEHDRTLKEVQELIENSDPLKRDFGGDAEAYKRWKVESMLSEGKDKGTVSKILSSDLNNMSDIEVLTMYEQYLSPRLAGKDSVIKRGILEEIGVDFDTYREQNEKEFNINKPELTDTQDYKLTSKASQARNYLSNLINETSSKVEIPQSTNIQEEIKAKLDKEKATFEETKKGWESTKDKLKSALSEINFNKKDKDGNALFDYTYKVDGSELDKITESVVKYAISQGYEPTEENLSKVVERGAGVLFEQHRNDIMFAAVQEEATRRLEEYKKGLHNTQPVNSTDAPETTPDQQAQIDNALKRLGAM